MPLPCSCHVLAMLLPCACHVFAMPWPCSCWAATWQLITMHVLCCCRVIAMVLPRFFRGLNDVLRCVGAGTTPCCSMLSLASPRRCRPCVGARAPGVRRRADGRQSSQGDSLARASAPRLSSPRSGRPSCRADSCKGCRFCRSPPQPRPMPARASAARRNTAAGPSTGRGG